MKTLLFTCTMILLSVAGAIAQTTEAEAKLRKEKEGLAEGWKKGGLFSLSFTQVSLTNWAAGGQNSISGTGLANLYGDYRKGNFTWNSSLDLGYGLMRQGKDGVIKTDDKVNFLSKAGMRAANDWYYACLLNFRTQMTPGYNYPNDTVKISKFLAPAYLLGALGIDYKKSDKFTLFLAPVTGKITIVNDDVLSNAGSFGVDPGKRSRSELGGYIRAAYKTDITPNIAFQTKADLFSNYLKEPQNIDVNWETLLLMKAGKFITVSFATHLIYDADILFDATEVGEGESRVQFKQLLGVGLSYKF